MPMIECTLISGYEAHTRQMLARRLTDAACATIGAHQIVHLLPSEVASENYMRGRIKEILLKRPNSRRRLSDSFLMLWNNERLAAPRNFLQRDLRWCFRAITGFRHSISWYRGQKRVTSLFTKPMTGLIHHFRATKHG